MDKKEQERSALLSGVRSYKSRQTIFEVSKANSSKEVIDVMKSKRKYHGGIVSKVRAEKAATPSLAEQLLSSGSRKDDSLTTDELNKAFKNPFSQNCRESAKKDENFFVQYKPREGAEADENSYSMASSFGQQARTVSFEMVGDENSSLRDQKNRKKWDRRKKKYVQEGGNESKKKMILTESGAYVPASYKSNLYKDWKQKNKVDSMEDGGTSSSQVSDRLARKHLGGKRAFHESSASSNKPKKSKVRSELKSKTDILKERKEKEKTPCEDWKTFCR